MSRHRIRFELNGVAQEIEVPAERLLLDLLRDDLALTGTKKGCSVGVCGSCSVLVDGVLLSACLLPAMFVDGCAVRTIEGLADGDRLTPLQQAFMDRGGYQCGICTPGQIIAATALLERTPRPTDAELGSWMMGNLCRCTGYLGIARSIRTAAGIDS